MMIIGGKKPAPAKMETAVSSENIFDVNTDQFETDILKASMDTPILVDFWAPWCEPCKQLGPILEEAVNATNGKVKLAKINLDENPQLAQALRVQSIPTVYAFFQGQPVTAFAGVRPASEIKALIDQLAKMARQSQPDAINIPDTLAAAAKALADGDVPGAQALYAQILGQEETNAAAYAGLARSFIAAGNLEEAGYVIDDVPEAIANDPAFLAAKTALDLARNAPGAGELQKLAAAVEKDAGNHQSRFDYALALFAAGQKSQAVDALIEIIRRDKPNETKWNDGKAKTQLFQFFDAMGPADPETAAGRRKLSTLLFA